MRADDGVINLLDGFSVMKTSFIISQHLTQCQKARRNAKRYLPLMNVPSVQANVIIACQYGYSFSPAITRP
jgi:hypothetical protein